MGIDDKFAIALAAVAFVAYLLVQEPPSILEQNYLDDAKYLADHKPLGLNHDSSTRSRPDTIGASERELD